MSVGMDNATTRDAIAGRLKAARSKIFPTASEAARALGMKPVTARAHESGQNGIDYFDLERYARRYGVAIGWLLTGEGAEDPQPSVHVELGEAIPILGVIEDGVWMDDDPAAHEYPMRDFNQSPSVREFTTYADPRFPTDLVTGMRVATAKTDGPYVDGSVIFYVPAHMIGYKDGDHVVVFLEDRNRDKVQVTLRRASWRNGDVYFDPLISDQPAFPYSDSVKDGILTGIHGVVIGSVQRRRVNEISLDTRRELEGYTRPRLSGGPFRPGGQAKHDAENEEIARQYRGEHPDDAQK